MEKVCSLYCTLLQTLIGSLMSVTAGSKSLSWQEIFRSVYILIYI